MATRIAMHPGTACMALGRAKQDAYKNRKPVPTTLVKVECKRDDMEITIQPPAPSTTSTSQSPTTAHTTSTTATRKNISGAQGKIANKKRRTGHFKKLY
jgi:hypothetical protein